TICTIASCPASSAVRDGSRSAPTFIERQGTDFSRPPPAASPDHIRQEPQETCALDRPRELTLLLGRHCSDAAWHDLAALGHVALQQAGVLVVDLRRIGPGERASLAAAEERPAGLRWCKAHGGHSSVASAAVASSRGGRLSRRWSPRSPRARKSPRSPRARDPPATRSREPPRASPSPSRSRSRSTLRIITDGPSSCSSTRTVR